MFDAEFGGRIRVHLHVGCRAELVGITYLAGTGAGMKMFHHASRVQPEGVFLVRPFVIVDKGQGNQFRLAAGILEFSIRVQALRTFGCRVLVAGPLDAAAGFNLVVAHAGVIEHAAFGKFFQLVEDAFGRFREIHLAALFKSTGDLVEDP